MNTHLSNTISIEERLTYIDDCELSDDYSGDEVDGPAPRRVRRSLEVDEKKEGAAVVANNVVSFVSGMSKQNKEDIKNSILFATLVANKACPELSGERWYNKYMEVMHNACGWAPNGLGYAKYTATEQSFTMDEVGLAILTKAVAAIAVPGANALALIGVAQQALEALSASQKPLKLFESKSRTHTGGAFNIASCVESEDGEVAMSVGYVDFSTTQRVTDVLFLNWHSDSVSISQVATALMFNQSVHAEVRDDLLAKLGKNAVSAVEEYEI